MGEEYELLVPSPTSSPAFLGGLSQHLRSEILLRIFQFDFFRDGRAVIADCRRTTLLLNQNRFRSWAEYPPQTHRSSWLVPRNTFSRAAATNQTRIALSDIPLRTTYALAPVKPHRHGGPLIRLPMVC